MYQTVSKRGSTVQTFLEPYICSIALVDIDFWSTLLCFLQVDLAELRQKLNSMESLQKELELLRRQKAAADKDAAAAVPPQQSGGVWGWLAGTPNGKALET